MTTLTKWQAANRGRRVLEQMGWPTHYRQLYQALGLNDTEHLPKEHMPPRIIGGVSVWVMSQAAAQAEAKDNRRRFVHRVIANCPRCDMELPASRLHQHIDSARCIARGDVLALRYAGAR